MLSLFVKTKLHLDSIQPTRTVCKGRRKMFAIFASVKNGVHSFVDCSIVLKEYGNTILCCLFGVLWNSQNITALCIVYQDQQEGLGLK